MRYGCLWPRRGRCHPGGFSRVVLGRPFVRAKDRPSWIVRGVWSVAALAEEQSRPKPRGSYTSYEWHPAHLMLGVAES